MEIVEGHYEEWNKGNEENERSNGRSKVVGGQSHIEWKRKK